MIAQLEGIVRAVESFSDPDAAEVPARYLRPALGVHAQHAPASSALHLAHEAAMVDSPFAIGGAPPAGAATGFTRTPLPHGHGHAGPGGRGGLASSAHGTPSDLTKPTPLAVAGMSSGHSDSLSFDTGHRPGGDLKHDVSAALAAATAAAAAAAAAAGGPGGGTPGAARSEEMVDDFGMHIENTLSEARLVLGRVDAARKRLTLKMARARNETLKASMLVSRSAAGCGVRPVLYAGCRRDRLQPVHAHALGGCRSSW